ncbi:MAG TPA: hypothetical protein VG796_25250 [Verrucomicrobiales bacterium]|nr:hypothetical protein [Verrucomicrobiales bacterium]
MVISRSRYLFCFLAALRFAVLPLQSQELKITHTAFNAQNQFVVEADIPAGAGHAVLEVMRQPATAGWRSMIAGGIDGRAAKVTFRLPKSAASAIARVKAGVSITLPAAELTDAALCTVTYSGNGGDITAMQAKLDMLNAADEKFATVSTLPRPQLQAAMIAWAKSFPIVEDASVAPTTDNVSIRFTDGTYAVLLNAKRTDGNVPPNLVPQGKRIPAPEEEEWIAPPAGIAAQGVQQAAGAQPGLGPDGSVPANRRAVCMFSLESWFPSSISKVTGWLQEANYVTEEYPMTPVNHLMWLSFTGNELGVLFWQAHAFTFKKKDGTEEGAIVTGQFALSAHDALGYQELLANGELTLAKDEARQDPPIYAVTPAFIRKYFRFAPHSLVMLDACYGGHPLIAGAFIDAGAGAVGSWDHESGKQSATCMLKVFDRLLGANKEAPISFPPERPFSLPVVRMWMEMFSYDFDPSAKYPNQTTDNARLIWRKHPSKPALILRPAVMRILHEFSSDGEESFTKYLIEGDFGYDPGPSKRQVLWGGQPMNVLRWQQDYGIVIRPPLSPPKGNIQVIINQHWESNETPMTEWTVPFTANYTSQGTLQYTVTMNAKFRADVHGSRGMPEQLVQYLPTMFTTLGDSTGQVTASGSWQVSENTVVEWSGGTQLYSVDPAVPFEVHPPDDTIECSGAINPFTGTVDAFKLVSRGRFTETSTNQPSKLVAGGAYFISPLVQPRINQGSNAFMGGSFTYPSGGGGGGGLSWPTTMPEMAPAVETVR